MTGGETLSRNMNEEIEIFLAKYRASIKMIANSALLYVTQTNRGPYPRYNF